MRDLLGGPPPQPPRHLTALAGIRGAGSRVRGGAAEVLERAVFYILAVLDTQGSQQAATLTTTMASMKLHDAT